mgnify:CR=1 FL=1
MTLRMKLKKEDSSSNNLKRENVNTDSIKMKSTEFINYHKKCHYNMCFFTFILKISNLVKIFSIELNIKNFLKYHCRWDWISMKVKLFIISSKNLWLWFSSANPLFPIFNDGFKKPSTSVFIIVLFIFIVGLSSWACSFSLLPFVHIFLWHLGSNVDSTLVNWLCVSFSQWRDWCWLFWECE